MQSSVQQFAPRCKVFCRDSTALGVDFVAVFCGLRQRAFGASVQLVVIMMVLVEVIVVVVVVVVVGGGWRVGGWWWWWWWWWWW